MSSLWGELPPGFLKKGDRGWDRLDYAVKLLIVELAEQQNFKCAFCSKNRGLIIEHDHYPEQGPGDRPTIHNIRGLTCHGCNVHLEWYEKEQRGDYVGLDSVYSRIDSSDYETYIYDYDCRIIRYHEKRLETCPNYWPRRLFLNKFDEWGKDGWRREYPWKWEFEEIKRKRHGLIRTPKQALNCLVACMKFVAEEIKKDPNFQPPEAFIDLMIRLKPLFEVIRPRYEAIVAKRDLAAQSKAPGAADH